MVLLRGASTPLNFSRLHLEHTSMECSPVEEVGPCSGPEPAAKPARLDCRVGPRSLLLILP